MDLIEQFAKVDFSCEHLNSRESHANICPTCDIPMDIQGDEYVCCRCKRIAPHIDGHLTSDPFRSTYDRRSYSSSDPLCSQKKSVYENLLIHRETYLKMIAAQRGYTYVANSSLVDGSGGLNDLAPSTAILATVAKIYNDIQRKSCAKGTLFVRRGDVKNEILAAILYNECGKSEQRSKKEIAMMMGLRTEGFSRGIEQLLLQASCDNITLNDDMEICSNKIAYYYKHTLGAHMESHPEQCAWAKNPAHVIELLRARFTRFIHAIVNCAIKHHIGVQSQLQSKIVGTIWFIARAMNYPIAPQEMDTLSGGIKKGTFMKFARAIVKSARLRSIARKYFPHLPAKELMLADLVKCSA